MSTVFHPQTDGATEQANRSMAQILCMVIDNDQKNWSEKCSMVKFVIETSEVIYITVANHSKTARSVAHRHTITCARRIQQNMLNTLRPNAPQPKRTTRSMIEAHTSSSGAHILTLLDQIDTTLLYHRIPNGITLHTYLFPLWRWHVCSSIGIHAHTSCGRSSYQ